MAFFAVASVARWPLVAAIASVVDPGVHEFSNSDQAYATLPSSYRAYIKRFGLRGLAVTRLTGAEAIWMVVATRDAGSQPFDAEELAEITTYIEYASHAVESALHVQAEVLEQEEDRVRGPWVAGGQQCALLI